MHFELFNITLKFILNAPHMNIKPILSNFTKKIGRIEAEITGEHRRL